MTETPQQILDSIIARFGPAEQKLIKALRRAVKARFKTCNELVYDYGFSLVLGYSPTEKGYESIVTISAKGDGVALYFLNGPKLPDPKKLLMGSAKQVRFVQLDSAARLKQPAVEALIKAAIEYSKAKPPRSGRGTMIIQANAKKKAKHK